MAQTLHQQRAIRAYIANGGHAEPMVRWELERAAHAEVQDLLRNAAREQPSVTFAPDERIPTLGSRVVEALRDGLGFAWPVWTALYGALVLGGIAGAVAIGLALAQPVVQP